MTSFSLPLWHRGNAQAPPFSLGGIRPSEWGGEEEELSASRKSQSLETTAMRQGGLTSPPSPAQFYLSMTYAFKNRSSRRAPPKFVRDLSTMQS
ncbi:uncharacterized protein VTP21DRAFT_4882 [Calcarisporiella thermophila]|uniref:uncharacterized protein n=1 Tax=Calcarisporiella thermophila TaxID=911321 RepID=UPI003743462E